MLPDQRSCWIPVAPGAPTDLSKSTEIWLTKSELISATYGIRTELAKSRGLEKDGRRERNFTLGRLRAVHSFAREGPCLLGILRADEPVENIWCGATGGGRGIWNPGTAACGCRLITWRASTRSCSVWVARNQLGRLPKGNWDPTFSAQPNEIRRVSANYRGAILSGRCALRTPLGLPTAPLDPFPQHLIDACLPAWAGCPEMARTPAATGEYAYVPSHRPSSAGRAGE